MPPRTRRNAERELEHQEMHSRRHQQRQQESRNERRFNPLATSSSTTSSRKKSRGTRHSKRSTEPVSLQDSSANLRLSEGTGNPTAISQSSTNFLAIEKTIGTASHNLSYSSSSGDADAESIRQQFFDSWGMGHMDTEFHSDQSITRATVFEKAHHFTVENAPITNIGKQINISHWHVDHRGSLDMLEKFVAFDALHDSSVQDPERCCHPDTRKAVLAQICDWADDPTRPERILWLHGPAGVGKSAIAQTISNTFSRDKVGATFFFFRSDPIRNDGNRLPPTLAWQLASSVPSVKRLIAASLEEYPGLPRKTVEIQFDRLISQPFLTISSEESASSTSTRVIIIDGLDECADMKLQERILKIIGKSVSHSRFPLRFLVSCRPEADIQDFFNQFQPPILQIDLANIDDTFRDIEMYFTSEFARIARDHQLDPVSWPNRSIIDRLVSKSSGQFVYASTVTKYVGDKNESADAQLNIILGLGKNRIGKSPFSELDALYTEILQRQRDQGFLKDFLLVLVARSRIIGQFDNANFHEDDAMLLGLDEKLMYRKLRGMHSLLKFKPSLDVHHKSFLDFLDDSSRSGEYHVSKHCANRRYIQLITDALVKAASRAIDQHYSHDNDHFQPRFATAIMDFSLPIELPLADLEEILQPLQIIQEKVLQLPNMSVPWKPRACHECWTFSIIDDLLLHLACFRGAIPQEQNIRPLTSMEEKQGIPQLDLDTCLSLVLSNLRNANSHLSLDMDTIGLVRALVLFDPTGTAMRVRSITDAQNLIELILCLNKNQCFKSWFGAAAPNATRLALAIYGRVPILPRSLFLNSVDLDEAKRTYQGKAIEFVYSDTFIWQECFNAFMMANLSDANIGDLLGLCSFQTHMVWVLPPKENGTLQEWRQSTGPSVFKIQQIVFEVAKAIQYVHSLGIVLRPYIELADHYLDFDNHVKVECTCFRPTCLGDRQVEYDGYEADFTFEANVYSFGLLFYRVLFNVFDPDTTTIELLPTEPEIPDKVWQLIQWCCAEDPEGRPTIDQVIQEMETWTSLS